MEQKRGSSRTAPSRTAHSSSESNSNSPASPASPAPGGGRPATANAFANDGSFMEMFKKKMEEEQRKKQLEPGCSDKNSAEEGQATPEKKPAPLTSFVGKRRGGAKLALKTGMVAKKQKIDSKESGKSDAWSQYMAEVKKYKAHQCGDDDKTRPLVK